MDLEFLRSFLVIADKGNLSAAAEELNISSSALSSSLHKLEEEMDCLLFERSPKGLTLTDSGLYFLNWAKSNVVFQDRLKEKLAQSLICKGTIRIGTKVESDTLFILLSAFQKKYPDITVEIHGENALPQNYLSTDLDMFLIPKSEQGDLPGVLIARRNSIFVLMRENHRLADRDEITIDELKNERFVLSSYRGKMEWMYDFCEMHGLTENIQYLCEDYDGKMSVIAHSNVLAFSYNTMRLLRDNMNGIRAVPLKEEHEVLEEFYLVWRKEPLNPLAEVLADFALEFRRLGREAFLSREK